MNKILEDSLKLAYCWQKQVEINVSKEEKRRQSKFSILVKNDKVKKIIVNLLDRSFRTEKSKKVINQAVYIFSLYGIPEYFNKAERFLIGLLDVFGKISSKITAFIFKEKIRLETSGIIFFSENKYLDKHIQVRNNQNIKININVLGETVLGEIESNNRLNEYINILKDPRVNYISIKLSAIYSQLHPLGHDESLKILIERFSKLLKTAKENKVIIDNKSTSKFINIDMEEYKDLELTFEVFTKTLDKEEFKDVSAGIVLQAYLPDSFNYQKKLIKWSKERVLRGGSSIKMRLVKGANKQVEMVDSSIHGWESPIYERKIETDANFLKMLEYGIEEENIKVVNLGIASHNIFNIAYAAELTKTKNLVNYLTFEMLEGMADGVSKQILKSGYKVLMYTPITSKKDFLNAVAYLVRRLDENTEKDNFLRHSFGMKVDSEEWNFLRNQFIEAHSIKDKLSNKPRRLQNRYENLNAINKFEEKIFKNERETDFNLLINYGWAKEIRDSWKKNVNNKPIELKQYIGNNESKTIKSKIFYDPNQKEKIPIYKVDLAEQKDIEEIIEIVSKDKMGWRKKTDEQRIKVIKEVANKFRERRGHMIGCMASVTGKVFMEADNEITEAIDFAEYYPYSYYKLKEESGCEFEGKGVVLVISPWNFPMAIPAGGVLAALMAGNTVILKPAPESFPVAIEFAKLIWEAGISKETFQVVCCEEGEDLDYLVSHRSINHIIFTGGTETAKIIINKRPDIVISAETGGKNAIIVTSMSDWDLAVKDISTSAFSNSGQKCSCASLLILEKELFRSKKFKDKLYDCVSSLKIGSAWEIENFMGPLITSNNIKLQQAIKNEEKVKWLLEPKVINNNDKIISPGILWGIDKNNFCYKNEIFGPFLAVMEAENLEEAVKLANTNYGLTSGLHSLDKREQEYWLKHIEAGNLYINRQITGAIVQRQPFGGIKDSSFGFGIKAGGTNYILQLMNVKTKFNKKSERIINLSNYVNELIKIEINGIKPYLAYENELYENEHYFKKHFEGEYDFSNVLGQRNVLRYLQNIPIKLRVNKSYLERDLIRIIPIMILCKVKLSVSLCSDFVKIFDKVNGYKIEELLQILKIDYQIEKVEDFIFKINDRTRVRILGESNENIKIKERVSGKYGIVIDHYYIGNLRTEAIYYMQEQSISFNYHRYGNCNLED